MIWFAQKSFIISTNSFLIVFQHFLIKWKFMSSDPGLLSLPQSHMASLISSSPKGWHKKMFSSSFSFSKCTQWRVDLSSPISWKCLKVFNSTWHFVLLRCTVDHILLFSSFFEFHDSFFLMYIIYKSVVDLRQY